METIPADIEFQHLAELERISRVLNLERRDESTKKNKPPSEVQKAARFV